MITIEELVRLFMQGLAFALVAALWLAGIIVWLMLRSREARRIQQRLGLTGGSDEERVLRLWHEGQISETVVPGISRLTLLQRLARLGQDAGWQVPMIRVLVWYTLVVILTSTAVYLLSENVLIALVSIVVMVVAFRIVLLRAIDRRLALFEKQLVDALDLGGRSLRAGHPLTGAFQLMAEEIDAPLGNIFADICEQESLGVSLQDALLAASAASRTADMKIFAVSVVIQLRSGGNLADMMDRVATVIRERMRLNRRARVLTAEAQLSKWVLVALPLVMLVLLSVINPRYMQPLYSTFPGRVMMLSGGISMIIGAWVMNRLAILKY